MSQAHSPNAVGTVVPIWGGGGGGPPPPGTAHFKVFAFTQADLVAGVFTALHNFVNPYVSFAVYDDAELVVVPDAAEAVDGNTFEIELSSFEPIPGTWHLVVVG